MAESFEQMMNRLKREEFAAQASQQSMVDETAISSEFTDVDELIANANVIQEEEVVSNNEDVDESSEHGDNEVIDDDARDSDNSDDVVIPETDVFDTDDTDFDKEALDDARESRYTVENLIDEPILDDDMSVEVEVDMAGNTYMTASPPSQINTFEAIDVQFRKEQAKRRGVSNETVTRKYTQGHSYKSAKDTQDITSVRLPVDLVEYIERVMFEQGVYNVSRPQMIAGCLYGLFGIYPTQGSSSTDVYETLYAVIDRIDAMVRDTDMELDGRVFQLTKDVKMLRELVNEEHSMLYDILAMSAKHYAAYGGITDTKMADSIKYDTNVVEHMLKTVRSESGKIKQRDKETQGRNIKK